MDITNSCILTSESVSEGHPDKICDQISDAILDACLEQDHKSRVACETLVTTDQIIIAGEISSSANVDYRSISRDILRQIGYTKEELRFSADTCKIDIFVHQQSPDIYQGINENDGLYKEQGAGDQGIMFGYAVNETVELMPAPIFYAHKIMERLAHIRKENPETYHYLRPDAKCQLSFHYYDNKPVALDTIVLSHQHSENANFNQLFTLVQNVVNELIPVSLLAKKPSYFINPTGRFVIGGPHGDVGLTGRKIIVDTYGGFSSHGGGAFSGKDPSKVDRSAAYMCRYIAKNIVAAKLAERCEIQISYAIGVAQPVSINVNTFNTGILPDVQITALLRSGDVFDLRPANIIRKLGLRMPKENGWSYCQTAAYGHFGRSIFTWEQTNRVDDLKAAVA